jgi:hypothetical protein
MLFLLKILVLFNKLQNITYDQGQCNEYFLIFHNVGIAELYVND